MMCPRPTTSDAPPPVPLWVKVLGVLALLVLLALVIGHATGLAGPGLHSARHNTPARAPTAVAPYATVATRGAQPTFLARLP